MAAPELEQDAYDVVVFGTGLAESIAAAALAKAGKTILHLDPNEYYAAEQASLTLDELVQWSEKHNGAAGSSSSSSSPTSNAARYSQATCSTLTPELETNRRRYALSLFPSVLPSRGELIDTLIKSDVSKYVSFRMLDSVSIWEESPESSDTSSERSGGKGKGRLRRVPGSKEEVFKDKSVSLMDKRRLMKFLMFASGEFETDDLLRGKEEMPLKQFLSGSFSLPPKLSSSVLYAISHCSSDDDPTLPALTRTRRYLRSVGRYGSGAFLVGQYGGAGEVAQGFCRACAVFGGTYVLGSGAKPKSMNVRADSVELDLPCHPRRVTATKIISNPFPLSSEYAPQGASLNMARCIAILDALPDALKRPKADETEDEEKNDEDDTAIIIFPPTKAGGHVVRALMMGEGTGSCPSGQFILYLSTRVNESSDPRTILQPYLHRLSSTPIFESYYISHHTVAVDDLTEDSPVVLLTPYAGLEGMTEGLDFEAAQGKRAYERVMSKEEGSRAFFEKTAEEEAEGMEMEGEEL